MCYEVQALLTANLVDVLQGEAQGLVCGAGGGQDGVQSLQQGDAGGTALLALYLPTLEPAHLKKMESADTETERGLGKSDEGKQKNDD